MPLLYSGAAEEKFAPVSSVVMLITDVAAPAPSAGSVGLGEYAVPATNDVAILRDRSMLMLQSVAFGTPVAPTSNSYIFKRRSVVTVHSSIVPLDVVETVPW